MVLATRLARVAGLVAVATAFPAFAAAHVQRGSAADHATCVSPELQAYVLQQSEANRKRLGLTAARAGDASADEGGIAGVLPPVVLPFFPMAGNTDRGDIVNGQFVDLDPTAGTQDYLCRTSVGNTHAGIDCGMLTFAHQAIGVPVFAAKDGTVVFAQDGFPDMNEFGSAQQGNIVAIDHGGSPPVETQYYHLKNGSVIVSVGQQVKAGQQIGMAASSGNSFGPHLHFQTMVNGQVYEPFAGPCRAGPSAWSNQAPLEGNNLYLMDFGFTRADLSQPTSPPWWGPWPTPVDSQYSLSDAHIRFYWEVWMFPVDCPYRVRFYRPNNSLAAEHFFSWGNTAPIQHMKSWSQFDFAPLGPVAGTWRIEFLLNNQMMIDAPFDVVNGPVDPAFNRPPQPITVAFDPPAPSVSDVVFCRVSVAGGGGQARDDLDWDIVRYRYQWKVNGITVRDVTTAAQSDAIPHHLACGGSMLTCTVTPNDGAVNGAPAVASVVVTGSHGPDVNCSGHVDVDDLIAVILGWGPCPVPPNACAADTNSSGAVDVDDLIAVILNWG